MAGMWFFLFFLNNLLVQGLCVFHRSSKPLNNTKVKSCQMENDDKVIELDKSFHLFGVYYKYSWGLPNQKSKLVGCQVWFVLCTNWLIKRWISWQCKSMLGNAPLKWDSYVQKKIENNDPCASLAPDPGFTGWVGLLSEISAGFFWFFWAKGFVETNPYLYHLVVSWNTVCYGEAAHL